MPYTRVEEVRDELRKLSGLVGEVTFKYVDVGRDSLVGPYWDGSCVYGAAVIQVRGLVSLDLAAITLIGLVTAAVRYQHAIRLLESFSGHRSESEWNTWVTNKNRFLGIE